MARHQFELIETSAPGKLMLLGEYACLYGYPAIVTAINRRIRVQIYPQPNSLIVLETSYGKWEGEKEDITFDRSPLDLTKYIIKTLAPTQGFLCTITSDFSDQMGWGSSSALIVALTAGLLTLKGDAPDPFSIYQTAFYKIVLPYHQVGSGADIAASVWGGILAYQKIPFSISHLPHLPFVAVYSGKKAKTTSMIHRVWESFTYLPHLYTELIATIGQSTIQAISFWNQKKWKGVGQITNLQHDLFKLLQVSTPELDRLVSQLQDDTNVLGAKLSGAGGGDCAIGFTFSFPLSIQLPLLDIQSDFHGVQIRTT